MKHKAKKKKLPVARLHRDISVISLEKGISTFLSLVCNGWEVFQHLCEASHFLLHYPFITLSFLKQLAHFLFNQEHLKLSNGFHCSLDMRSLEMHVFCSFTIAVSSCIGEADFSFC